MLLDERKQLPANHIMLRNGNCRRLKQTRTEPLYQWIAGAVAHPDWDEDLIVQLEAMLPRGSGVDSGTKIVCGSKPTPNKFTLEFAYHHMNENGFYDGWTHHKCVVVPSFGCGGFDFRITGPNRRQIKEYLEQLFYDALSAPVTRYAYDVPGVDEIEFEFREDYYTQCYFKRHSECDPIYLGW